MDLAFGQTWMTAHMQVSFLLRLLFPNQTQYGGQISTATKTARSALPSCPPNQRCQHHRPHYSSSDALESAAL
jgi:hypothetical protein